MRGTGGCGPTILVCMSSSASSSSSSLSPFPPRGGSSPSRSPPPRCCCSWCPRLSCSLAWSSSSPSFCGCLRSRTPLHSASSRSEQRWWVLGRASRPASPGVILLVVGLSLVTVVVVCPFVVGVGVVLSCPVVFVSMAPLPFCH